MRFNIYTLGCKVNAYESSVMSDKLKNAGFIEISLDSNADISIINTCTVTNQADHKSAKIIRRAIKNNPNAIIVVCGCFSQNKKEEAIKIEGVDIVIGTLYKSKIVDYINQYLKDKKQIVDVYDLKKLEFEPMELNNFNKTRAFVKIQDGCNNFCSYCVIPYTRGNVRSKKRDDVLNEVKNLIKNGHREIVLTGIHTGNYGVEFDNYDFADLLNELVSIPNLERLRISSIEITELNDRVLDVLSKSNVLVDHMHIPIQSGSDNVLKRMNRKYDKRYFINKIEKIRSIRPNISITTDVIVGFPGETEEEFIETIETIKKVHFSALHIFPYSKRDKTKASLMPNQIDDNTKKSRVKILLNLSKELEIDYMKKFIDNEISFIPEVIKDDTLIGHTGNYLQIKCKGLKEDLHKNIKVKLESVNYPYIEASKIDYLVKN